MALAFREQNLTLPVPTLLERCTGRLSWISSLNTNMGAVDVIKAPFHK